MPTWGSDGGFPVPSSTFLVSQVAAALLLPPFSLMMLVCCGLWFSRRSLVYLALLLWYLLSIPAVAFWLNQSLFPPVTTPAAVRQVDAIVVLGGGSQWAAEYADTELGAASLMRLRYAAWLARQTGKPLLLSGGAPEGGPAEAVLMAKTLARDGQPAARWQESRSINTQQNAAYGAAILKAAGVRRIALVSSAWHLRRASRAFEQQGLLVLPAPTGVPRTGRIWLLNWLPASSAIQESRVALREWLGLLVGR